MRTLLGSRVTDVVARRRTLTIDRFDTPEEWRDFFKTVYGPTIAVYRSLGTDLDRINALDRDLAALGERYDCGVGTTVMDLGIPPPHRSQDPMRSCPTTAPV